MSTEFIYAEASGHLAVSWGAKGTGFGHLTIKAKSDGRLYIDSECMDRPFIKAMLCKMVDDAQLDGEPDAQKSEDT